MGKVVVLVIVLVQLKQHCQNIGCSLISSVKFTSLLPESQLLLKWISCFVLFCKILLQPELPLIII